MKYLNIYTTKDVMNNSVLGIIETDDRNVTVETNFNTLIDIKGKIIVKYVDKDSNNDLFDSINTTNKVGIVYKLDKKEIFDVCFLIIFVYERGIYFYKEDTQNTQSICKII